ncbi:hypothetical protein BWQ96_06968 [Gracilariopsis chorda]|uniref:Uncharacterized protein n=1 Tax=Gracilariopsis chorda TaxID=448386 RepID=A0A2V3IMQ7_9FLOR|nr:hypothetical protein BWQ96_06968 [Gracilariopsis chorda]|eukprot:PXF43329.1 hypothetical protein BWQ96_06968 [Gracilariopsis chorda]
MSTNNSSDGKKPRSSPGNGTGFQSPSASPSNRPEQKKRATPPKAQRDTRNLQRLDRNGISLEHRLREEIKHPLRKPKQTLFGAFAFSATLGFFITLGRFAAVSDDSATQLFTNVAVNLTAASLFAYLTWTQVQFGRRSLNSIAGIPQARDLPIKRVSSSPSLTIPSWLSTGPQRLSSLLTTFDTVLVVGRKSELEKYLKRCQSTAENPQPAVALVVFATDFDKRNEEAYASGADAIALGEVKRDKDWLSWLANTLPSKRNIAVFRFARSDKAVNAADTYFVTQDLPASAPLPVEVVATSASVS